MKEYEKKAICRNWGHLKNSLFAKDLTKYFIEAEILTPDDDEAIRSFSTACDQNDRFLKLIIRKGAHSFATLVDALRKENDNDTASLLENTLRKTKQQDRPKSDSAQFCSEARCPHCSRPLVCPDCSPTYDDGYSAGPPALSTSYPPRRGIHKVQTFPGTGYNSCITEDLNTLPKTIDTQREDYVGYESLNFDDKKEQDDTEPVHFGLDYPDGPLPKQPESVQPVQETVREDTASGVIAEKFIPEAAISNQSHYSNTSNTASQWYENVSPDNKRIELKTALDLPEEEVRVNPDAENDKHFQYYNGHLRLEAGWHPGVYKIDDIENVLQDKCSKTETGQYLIWYEATKYCDPFISVHCQGIIHHFRIEMSPSTETKKKIFYIDREWEFHKLEELLTHVKKYGISLDREFRPEAGLF